jgi:hypothetical protein
MLRFLTFFGITLIAIYGLYNASWILSYIYYTYCSGLALGSPPCNYLLELLYLSATGVKNFWIYLGTLFTGLFLYSFNRLFSEISCINNKLSITSEEINKNRLYTVK